MLSIISVRLKRMYLEISSGTSGKAKHREVIPFVLDTRERAVRVQTTPRRQRT